ncbi:hypothetical protein [Algoriella sp.]|uniref:hypothetical protein n=1 Tax=Algoriella sp. TaxID=1872434 RepID=UPI002580E87A|nr:hypothetical protein [Algoriella sp.]
MKKLLYLLILGSLTTVSAQNSYDEKPFNNSKKEFNDWSVSAFGGTNLMQNSDLVSWSSGWFTPGFDAQFQVNKQISHAFGLSLQYQFGKSKQRGLIDDAAVTGYQGYANGKTKYQGITLLADINASNLLRRVDNKTEFKWAMHLYAGAGILGYKASRDNYKKGGGTDYVLVTDQKLADKSVFAQVGAGLRYKINEKFDVEARAMYVMSGDEEF